jgi:hypothetical protein
MANYPQFILDSHTRQLDSDEAGSCDTWVWLLR